MLYDNSFKAAVVNALNMWVINIWVFFISVLCLSFPAVLLLVVVELFLKNDSSVWCRCWTLILDF